MVITAFTLMLLESQSIFSCDNLDILVLLHLLCPETFNASSVLGYLLFNLIFGVTSSGFVII